MTTQPENQTEAQIEVQNHETTTSPATFPRVGKIARLPKAIRDELNARLEAGEGGEPLLDWLNQLPATRHVLELEFAGKPVSKQNLSEWRRGGFAEWQLRRSVLETVGETAAHAKAIHASAGRFFVDDVVTAFTAHYNHFLMGWGGEVSEAFEAKLRVFSRIRRDLSRMQRDAHWAFRDGDECDQLEAAAEKRRLAVLKHKAMGPERAAGLRWELIEKHGVDKGERMAELLNTIEFGEPYPSFFKDGELSGLPPEDGAEADAVEPKRRRRSPRKQKPATAKETEPSKNGESQPASQATPEPAKPVAVEATSDANAPVASSEVKPVSETTESRQEAGRLGETSNAEPRTPNIQ